MLPGAHRWDSGKRTHLSFLILCLHVTLASSQVTDELAGYSLCSVNSQFCDPRAECRESGDTWTCVCTGKLQGDGLRGDNHTGCGLFCTSNIDCHALATCDVTSNCACLEGYSGDGYDSCEDINECDLQVCHAHARCDNTPGSYTCVCKEDENYFGNGTVCRFRCSSSSDCLATQECRESECVCMAGYQDVQGECVDVDECVDGVHDCDVNAICTNTIGSFTCTCGPGYEDLDEGRNCRRYPINCYDIRQSEPNARSKRYWIDVDGPGPLEPKLVNCDMRETVSVTILKVVSGYTHTFTRQGTQTITYRESVEHITAVTETSGFCYQEMTFTCHDGAELAAGQFEWIDRISGSQTTWGGASRPNNCACGQFGGCANQSSACNCNGDLELRSDAGKIIQKELLPILGVNMDPNQGSGVTNIGHVYCAEKPFDIPLDCHDAKFNYNEQRDGAVLVDVDGPEGPLSPFLVSCLMTLFPHVGITVIPHDTPQLVVTSNQRNEITYQSNSSAIRALIDRSDFCQQEIGYTCTNSRLLNGGDVRGYFSDLDGNAKNYWGGGLGRENMCGCGVTETCDRTEYNCNCDIVDGETRRDFGKILRKEDLPVGSATFLDVGGDSQGEFTLGPLMCAQIQFGIPPTCQSYMDEGQEYSYTYLIDPDGPQTLNNGEAGNQEYFPVYCEMRTETSQGITVVYHSHTQIQITGAFWWLFEYREVTDEQVEKLTERATYCTQAVDIQCQETPIFDTDGTALVSWLTTEGYTKTYFSGDGQTDGCRCGLSGSCDDVSKLCNCDLADNQNRLDAGVLTRKDDLPVAMFSVLPAQSNATVGPLRCFETFPTCEELMGRARLGSENSPEDGMHYVDPDGPGGVEAFQVRCVENVTIISPNPVSPDNTTLDTPGTEKCFDITYSDTRGNPITPQQVQALVAASEHCEQSLDVTCVNSPLTNNHYYVTCDNEPQQGWAGSGGDDQCACGVTGTCSGGASAACNCDLMNNSTQVDGGSIVHKEGLAVCAVCLSLPSIPSGQEVNIPQRSVEYNLGKLKCGRKPIGVGSSCQARRNELDDTQPNTVMVNPGGGDAFPVFCDVTPHPPVGKLVIKPTDTNVTVPPDGIEHIINYYVFNFENIQRVINSSLYCTQALYLHCDGAVLNMTSQLDGFYSINGIRQVYWAGNEEGTPGCAGGVCNCQLGVDGQTDGGLIIDKSVLPVFKVTLGPSQGSRILEIGDLECFDIPRDCDEILRMGLNQNPNGDNIYAIDPDGAGGQDYFPVLCDFTTDINIGITVVRVIPGNEVTTVNGTGEVTWSVDYVDATVDQIHELTTISGFCHQGLTYECSSTQILGADTSYFLNYDGSRSTSFGSGFNSSVAGCACVVTNTCPEGEVCHCDQTGYIGQENGYLMDRAEMPVSELHFSGTSGDSSGTATLTNLRCGPIPFDLPVDCHQVYNRYSRETGEYVIWPRTSVEPFLVFCDMDMLKGKGGMTIIRNTREDFSNVTYDTVMEVTYYGADLEQIAMLLRVSRYCQQPIKYECRHTRFLESSLFYFNAGFTSYKTTKREMRYFGAGTAEEENCNCGRDGACGGSEEWSILETLGRKCNCDAADNESRADAGVLQVRSEVPVSAVYFQDPGLSGAQGSFKLGHLYCADVPFDLNECELGFHDCHEHARCINTVGAFRCECLPGYRGRGHNGRLLANGRNCYNDNECNLNKCPYSADCIDTPGSFQCICRSGFNQTGPRSCEDIDECSNGEHDCHSDAKCFNLPGSYVCRCKPGFRGNGTHCEPLARCACFGDPHCVSFDGRGLHYQGQCSYVLSGDSCTGGNTYLIVGEFWSRPDVRSAGDVTWVKEVIIQAYGFTVRLMQGGEIRVDGVRMTDPRRLSADLYILSLLGGLVKVYLGNGVEVEWNGRSTVEIFVPGALREQVCGLCGNYNSDPEDDWTVGPACPTYEGNTTLSSQLFGESWTSSLGSGASCPAICHETEEPEPCDDPDQRALATEICDSLFQRDPAFQLCFQEMGDDLEFYYRSCIYDVCEIGGDPAVAMCDVAENMVDTCLTDYKISVTEYIRSDYCEETTCDVNMEYSDCVPSTLPSCFDYLSTPSSPPEQLQAGDQCMPGCVCKAGYLLDQGTCVPPEECGCINNGVYYSAGETLTLGDCDEVGICRSGMGFNFSQIESCHENATCDLIDGRFGCHCNAGFYGDGINKCSENPCIVGPDRESPCTEHALCVPTLEVPEGYLCECLAGYAGDCGNCTDIDECATEIAECRGRSECRNTDGSYECVCGDGFRFYQGECHDINECEISRIKGTPICGNNSRCINRIGTYECPCCDGNVLNEASQECEASSAESAYTGTQCCTCSISVCEEPGRVCGEDGRTYGSIRDMILSRCEEGYTPGKQVVIDYFRACRASCSDTMCPLYQRCKVAPKTGLPTCVCEDCTQEEINSGEVCSESRVRYINMCEFKKTMCRHDLEIQILPNTDACTGKGQGPPVTPWSEWSACSETCGKGIKTKTREPRRDLTPEQQERLPLTKEADCYSPPCPDSVCVHYTCDNVAAECVPEGADEGPRCECPTCNNEGGDPVCGQIGAAGEPADTWPSLCHLHRRACQLNMDFALLHPGSCGVTPSECSRVPSMSYVFAEGTTCASAEEIDQFECEGGCGTNPALCCRATDMQEVLVDLTCNNGTTIQQTVGIISGCACQEQVAGAMP